MLHTFGRGGSLPMLRRRIFLDQEQDGHLRDSLIDVDRFQQASIFRHLHACDESSC